MQSGRGGMGVAKHRAATKKGKGNGRSYGRKFLFHLMLELRSFDRKPRRGTVWHDSVKDAFR